MAWFRRAPKTKELEARSSADTWYGDYLVPSSQYGGSFSYGGQSYPYGYGVKTSYGVTKAQEWSNTLPGYFAAVQRCPPAFAAQMVRAQVLSQARFTFRRRWATAQGVKDSTFNTAALDQLHRPWINATQSELISRMEWDAGLAGNAYITNFSAEGRLRVLRPDWVMIVYGSQREPDFPAQALDGKVIGYVYQNGGINSGIDQPVFLTPDTVAHWSPIPDPLNAGIGMSWLTPAVRELQGDQLAADHKVKFFENGATPNLVVKGIQASGSEEFLELVDRMEDAHAGVRNAYKTLYLTQGADATVVGANLGEINFGEIVSTGETRISMLSRVHSTILGASKGLEGSSLNAGNFGMARRIWADTWIYPTLQDMCAALAPLVKVPSGSDLWHDVADMPILREDAKDAADIMQLEATTVTTLVKEGFTAESAVAATKARDVSLLKHSGLVSVQLQPPGTEAPTPNGIAPAGLSGDGTGAALNGSRSADDAEEDELMRAIGEALHPGDTAKLKAYWSHGKGAAKIGWGAPGDFERCRAQLGKYVQRPDELAGLCANLHHDALGVWPGREHGHKG